MLPIAERSRPRVTNLLALGPAELFILLIVLLFGVLFLYGLYRIGYRVDRAEGALLERQKLQGG